MPRPPRRTLVFVLPWHTLPAHGGAETLVHAAAKRLAAAGAKVAIWTTTANPGGEGDDPQTRAFAAGETREGGLAIRRFESEPRDERRFHSLNERMRSGETLTIAEEAAFFRNWIWSEPMRRAIHEQRNDSLYIFAPYFAATTVFGVEAAPQESILLPCLHDEPETRMALVERTIQSCHHFLFNSEPERELAHRLFDLGDKITLTGAGVDYADAEPPVLSPLPVRARKPYLLSVGRQSAGKGAPELIDFFRRLMADSPLTFRLVLAGSGAPPIPSAYKDDIAHLGYVEDDVKWSLMANAQCFVLPSARESLSLSLLESWLCGRPALVNARGAAAAAHVARSGGGLPYHSYSEFRHALEYLARHPAEADAMGQRGRAYVRANFRWPDVVARQLRFFRDIEQWLHEAAVIGV